MIIYDGYKISLEEFDWYGSTIQHWRGQERRWIVDLSNFLPAAYSSVIVEVKSCG
jgi:hypothetical protein